MKFPLVNSLLGACLASLLTSPAAFAQWTDGGTNVYLTTSTDKVGIGTNSPTGKVQISTGDTDPQLRITQTNTSDWARLKMDAGTDIFSLSVGGASSATPNTFNLFVSGVGNMFSVKSNGMIGINNPLPVALFQVTNGATLFNGTTGSTPVSGAGTRLMWVPAKAAFRAGKVTGTQWDDASIGTGSIALAEDATASGAGSIAIGEGATASSSYAVALGLDASATHISSVAIGQFATANGVNSVSIGNRCSADAGYSTTIGSFNVIPSGASSGSWVDTDPLFVVANGTGTGSRSNAITVLKNGKMGVGTTAPKNVADVNGNMVIGSYAGVNTAPSNGLLVSGDVGIGATATSGYKLYVSGNSYFNGSGTYLTTWLQSDARLKKDIRTISGALDKVMHLRGVTYTYARNEFPEMNFPEGEQIGFVAQEVERVTPEMVHTSNSGFKAVAYQNMTAVLVEAMKEQQQMIDSQRETITRLENEQEAMKAMLIKLTQQLGGTSESGELKGMEMK